MTAPSTTASVARGGNLAVTWAPDAAVAAPAQFGVWLVKGGVWSLAAVYDADGSASYTRQVPVSVPVDTGYQVYVYYRASSGDAWSVGGLAAGTLDVTGGVFSSIAVTAPSTTASVARGGNLTVSWAPDAPVAAPAQFGVWLVKGGVWSLAAVYDADNGASYTRQVPVSVPVDTGYQVYVYYRATSGDAWSVGGLAAGTLDVTGGVFSSIAVSAPATTASVARGGNLTVSWAPDAPVAAPAQFGVWLVKGGVWSLAAVYDADNGASYTRQVPVSVPVDTGYQVYVYYRATSGDAWSVGGLAAGTLDVTGGVFSSIAVTAPATTASVARGGNLTVSWAPDAPVAAPAQFSVWLVKGGVWSLAAVYDADNGASYTRQVPVSVPVDTGYQVYVYYRATQRRRLERRRPRRRHARRDGRRLQLDRRHRPVHHGQRRPGRQPHGQLGARRGRRRPGPVRRLAGQGRRLVAGRRLRRRQLRQLHAPGAGQRAGGHRLPGLRLLPRQQRRRLERRRPRRRHARRDALSCWRKGGRAPTGLAHPFAAGQNRRRHVL